MRKGFSNKFYIIVLITLFAIPFVLGATNMFDSIFKPFGNIDISTRKRYRQRI